MKSPLSKELKNDTSEDLVEVDHTIVAQHVSSESVRLSRQSASSTTSTNLDPSDRTIEAPPTRRIVLYELEEGEDPYAIEDGLAVRRGFISAADEIDFMERNLSYGTTRSFQARNSYTRRPPTEAWIGLSRQRFGHHCGDLECSRCGTPLNLSADASDIPPSRPSVAHTEATSRLCGVCRHINFESLLSGVVSDREITLGYLSGVVNRHSCAFCRLVTASIELAFADRGLPFRDVKGRPTEIGIATRAKVDELNVQDLEIVLHPWERARYSAILIHRLKDQRDALPFCGRHVDPHMIDFAIVKAWLDSCEHNVAGTGHDVVEPPVTHDFAPSRLIDIERYYVVRSARRNYRYIALSYVWGGPQPLRLLLGNESRLMAPNGLLASGRDLPQTIHDAIEATRKLGERYLWIDALCIIQDDREFKQAELLLMGRIYARALLTIVAAYGCDVHAGLPGVSVVQRSAPQHVEYIHDMGLTNRLPTLSATVDQSVWNSRAWTFQERVLAKRKLYITKHQAMFICPHTEVELREDVYGSAIRPSETSNRSRREAGLHKYRLVPYNPDGSVPPSVNTAIYSSIVQQFCRRQTSFPAELLNIFAGITDYLAPYFRSTFIMGLPVSELDTQLLWRHSGPINRRVSRDTGRSLFPSWSWAGWTGARAGYIANARSSSALELHDADSDTWLTMDEIRGNDADVAWRLHDFYRGSFWRRGDETTNYYAHPIATSDSHAAFRPTLLSNNLGISDILPLRSEVIKVNVTGATNPDADRMPALSTRHDSISYQRALSLFNAKDVLVGTAFIPLSVFKTIEPGSYDFIKIGAVATGPDFIDTVDEYMDFLLCYACNIYGVSKIDSQDRIDGLLLRTENGISYRLGVAVCHVAGFESAHPTRTVVHLG